MAKSKRKYKNLRRMTRFIRVVARMIVLDHFKMRVLSGGFSKHPDIATMREAFGPIGVRWASPSSWTGMSISVGRHSNSQLEAEFAIDSIGAIELKVGGIQSDMAIRDRLTPSQARGMDYDSLYEWVRGLVERAVLWS